MSTTLELEKKPLSADDIITRGSTWAAIWHMSWPLVLNMTTIAMACFADMWVAGRLGSNTQAAMGICGQIWFFMILLAVALSSGTTALVSRFWGAKDLEAATEAARQSLLFATIFGVSSAALGLVLCRPLMHLLGASPAVAHLGWQYLQFDLLGHIPYTILWVSNSIFRAKGNARIPMLIMGFVTMLVISLDMGLCLWPLHMGITGLGMSWLIAGCLGLGISIKCLRKSRLGACLEVSKFISHGLSKEWFIRIMKIGLPSCLQDLFWIGGNFALFFIFAQTADPTSCQAAWAVGLRIEEVATTMLICALSMAVATIIGQNLGAGLEARAERAGWQVAAIGAAFNAAVGAILFFAAQPIAQIMSTDPKVVTISADYLRISGMAAPFVAVWLTLFGAMQGAGYTRWPMLATLVCLTFIRLPLSWFLAVHMKMGPIGCWIGVAISAVILGCLAIWRFSTGLWKLQKV